MDNGDGYVNAGVAAVFAGCGVELKAWIGGACDRGGGTRAAVAACPCIATVVAGERDIYGCSLRIGVRQTCVTYRTLVYCGGYWRARTALAAVRDVVGRDIVGGGR